MRAAPGALNITSHQNNYFISIRFRYVKKSEDEGSHGRGSGIGYNRSGGYGGNDRFRQGGNFGAPSRRNDGFADQPLKRINWSQETLAALCKNFYKPSDSVLARSKAEIDAFHQKHEITVRGHDTPATIFEFNEIEFPSYITTELTHQGFKQPTVIQSQSWPIAMSGRDMVGIAQTGSGKTLAYILPALVHITYQEKLQRGDGPIALVLAPTRELAQQIQTVATEFGKRIGIRNTCVFGGAPKRPQQNDLQRGCEIVIATPGRLIDFLSQESTNLKRCSYLVLDEADRMVRTIINRCVSLFTVSFTFSLTWVSSPKSARSSSRFAQTAKFSCGPQHGRRK